MPRYRVEYTNCRIYVALVEAETPEQARDIAEGRVPDQWPEVIDEESNGDEHVYRIEDAETGALVAFTESPH